MLSGFLTKHCIMWGIQSKAFLPITVLSVGTSLQPRSSAPSFSQIISSIFFAWAHLSSSCGKKNIPTPYSLEFGSSRDNSFATLLKKSCEIWISIPTPSPVSPEASLPARCWSFSTIDNASLTILCDCSPLMLTTAPIPQASCSNSGLYSVFCSFMSIYLTLL